MSDSKKLVVLDQIEELLKKSKSWTANTISDLTSIVSSTLSDMDSVKANVSDVEKAIGDLTEQIEGLGDCDCKEVDISGLQSMLYELFPEVTVPTPSNSTVYKNGENDKIVLKSSLPYNGNYKILETGFVIFDSEEDADKITNSEVITASSTETTIELDYETEKEEFWYRSYALILTDEKKTTTFSEPAYIQVSSIAGDMN